MYRLVVLLSFVLATSTARADDSWPDLTGTWSGTYSEVVFGGSDDQPISGESPERHRIVEIEFTILIEGQDGRLLWGQVFADPANSDDLAMTFTTDGQTVIGGDRDGYHNIRVISDSEIEDCFVMNGTNPSGAIVAGCARLTRQAE